MNTNTFDLDQAEKFMQLVEKAGVEFSAANVLKCIGFAKEAMRKGEVTVEAYFAAKRILLEKVEVASDLLN